MTHNRWHGTIWRGNCFEQRGRTVVLESPAYIFRCPLCEYRWPAGTREGADLTRCAHVRVAHVAQVAELAAADTIDALPRLPRHLRGG